MSRSIKRLGRVSAMAVAATAAVLMLAAAPAQAAVQSSGDFEIQKCADGRHPVCVD